MSNRRKTLRLTKLQRKWLRDTIKICIKKNADGCWITLPSRTGEPKKGPSIMRAFGLTRSMPVWSYLAWKGDLPIGTQVCHTCDVPRCVNPKHLWKGNSSENARDAFTKKRRKSPWIGHGPRAKHIELALGRRRIMMRWYGKNWRTTYKRFYKQVPMYLRGK